MNTRELEMTATEFRKYVAKRLIEDFYASNYYYITRVAMEIEAIACYDGQRRALKELDKRIGK